VVWITDRLPDALASEVRMRTRFGITEMKQAIEAAAPDRLPAQ
jgi:hypothetical protein